MKLANQVLKLCEALADTSAFNKADEISNGLKVVFMAYTTDFALLDRTILFNLQDARHPNQNTDKKFYDYINPKDFSIFLVFNKIDKLKKQKEKAALNKLKPQIYSEFKAVKQIFFVSAEKRTGVDALEQSVANYLFSRLDLLKSL